MENFQTCAPQSTLETISWKQFFQWGSPADENFSMPCAPQYLEFFFRWVSSGDKKMSMYRAPQYYWGFSQLRICRPPPSVFIRFLWMMRSVLKRMKKIIKKFSDFYFSSYREKFIENWGDDVTKWPKNDHYSKNENWKNLKYEFRIF